MATKFSDMNEPRPTGNLMIVDALNLAFRWKHSGDLIFADNYIKTVESLARSYNCGTVIITADWGSSTYRKNIYPDYKQNRKDLADSQTEQERVEFEMFFAEYENTLEKLAKKFTVFRFKGVEADDLAAWLVINRERYNFFNTWLISSDRDWDLLIREDVSRFSYVTRKETTLATWDYDVSPENYISYKCLIGDSGDNIPGVPGVGPKRAVALIKEYGDIFDIYSICDEIKSKNKYIQNLKECKEQLLINHELMDLTSYCSAAIGESNVQHMEWTLGSN